MGKAFWNKIVAVLVGILLGWLWLQTYIPWFLAAWHSPLGFSVVPDRLALAEQAIATGRYRDAEEVARSVLDAQPYNQRAFNLWIASRVARRDQLVDFDPLLAKLGYRDDQSQIRLIIAAEQSDNYQKMLQHVDAMLRREQRTDDLFDLLYDMEAFPKSREALAKYLATNPPWRLPFFGRFRPANIEDARNHIALLRTMAGLGATVHQSEMARAVDRSRERGGSDDAYAFWTAYQKLSGGQENGNSFLGSMTVDEAINGASSAFDWNFVMASGQNFLFDGKGEKSTLTIDWDGRGTPKLFWRVIKLTDHPVQVLVRVPDGGALDDLDFNLLCGSTFIPLEMRMIGTGQFLSQDVSIGDTGGCRYPEFSINGAPQGVGRPVTVRLNLISIS